MRRGHHLLDGGRELGLPLDKKERRENLKFV